MKKLLTLVTVLAVFISALTSCSSYNDRDDSDATTVDNSTTTVTTEAETTTAETTAETKAETTTVETTAETKTETTTVETTAETKAETTTAKTTAETKAETTAAKTTAESKAETTAAVKTTEAVINNANSNIVVSNGGNKMVSTDAFSKTIEAEDATLVGLNVKTAEKGYNGDGYISFSQKKDSKWSVEVDIPTSQFYTITARANSGQYKENYICVNDKTVATLITDKSNGFKDYVYEGIYLEKGKATFSISESWGYFNLDSLKIENGSVISSDYYKGVTSQLCNPNANEKTQEIMNFIVENYGKNVIAGQYTQHGESTEVEAIYEHTGKYPALRGFDFIFESPTSSWKPNKEVGQALDWAKKGGLLTFSWHWHAPMKENEFYSDKTSFDLSKAVTDKDLALMPLDDIEALYKKGEITEETFRTISDIDVISGHIQILEDAGVTILWRPLHEASGGWFWWGDSGADAYKWLWNLMYERQTNYHKLDNLIWVNNCQNKDWYPGDDVVDIIGMDIYAPKHDSSSQTGQFTRNADFSDSKKITALTENGVIPDADLMVRDNTYWSFFNTWCREFIVGADKKVHDEQTALDIIKKTYNHKNVITLDELPDFD